MKTVLVTGANRGLGLELARQYATDGWSVVATVREPDQATDLKNLAGNIRIESLELRDFQDIDAFADRFGAGPLDLLIANAGTWGPEQIERATDAEGWIDSFRVNTVGPVLLARSLLANVTAAHGKLIAITSKMGSIDDNGTGGYIAYRSSKAALNAAWKSLAIDVADQGVLAAVLHPGWVQTRMGGASAPLMPEQSVTGMRRTIDMLDARQSGGFFKYDGTTIPW